MTLYLALVFLHSWVRWIAIVAGIGATMAVWKKDSPNTTRVDRWSLFLMIALDLQVLLGLLLYVIGPVKTQAIKDFGETLHNPRLRFFAIDHVVIMVAAVVLVHVGRMLARKAASPEARRARLRLGFGLALAAMIAGTPWPGLIEGRPLIRWQLERD